MSPLFSSRVGISVVGGGAFCRASWPLGKITLDAEALTVDALFKSYRLRVADIDRVRRGLLTVDVEHHAPGVPRLVRLWGVRLFARLRKAIRRHQLRVEMSE
jgi:hypothetical protein